VFAESSFAAKKHDGGQEISLYQRDEKEMSKWGNKREKKTKSTKKTGKMSEKRGKRYFTLEAHIKFN